MEANIKSNRKETGNYCFPNPLANLLRRVSQRTQMESEMMSIVVILICLVVILFAVVFSDAGIFSKIMTVINTIAGFVFLSSRLVTSFQQYQNYLAFQGIISEEQGGFKDGIKEE